MEGQEITAEDGFQSTLPRRERRPHGVNIRKGDDFNPRSREGSDKNMTRETAVIEISIHAPAKGATVHTRKGSALHRNFNPRSREGSDAAGTSVMLEVPTISIHAPAKGATL